MVSKATAAVVLIGATFFTIPVYAAPPTTSPPQLAVEQPAAPSALPAGSAAQLAPPEQPAAPSAQAAPAPEATPAKEALKAPAHSASGDIDKLDLKFAKGFAVDAGKIVTSPVRWDSKDWIKAGLILGGTASLFLVDQKVKDFARSNQSPVASGFASVGNNMGTPIFILPALGAYYGYGAIADDHKARRVSLLALESFAISGIMTEGIKTLAGRHRPETGDSNMHWDGPRLKNASFSSGHTSSVFSVATVFANEYQDNKYVAPIAYGLASLTGLSRIYSNKHWSSDVFFGGALGYFVGKAVLKLHKEDKKDDFIKKLSVMPEVSKEMKGVSVKVDF